MKRMFMAILIVLMTGIAACAQDTKQSWRETGHSWRDGGRQFLRALGRSIAGEESPKEEWKETGEEFRKAGKNTAGALGESIDPD